MFKSNFITVITLYLILGICRGKNLNPYFDSAKSHHTPEGFTNPYLNNEDEKKSLIDLINMLKEDRPLVNSMKYNEITLFNVDNMENLPDKFAVWGGHSTLLLNLNGKLILTDPILSEYCSPVQFVGPKRYTKPALDKTILNLVDLVIISHNHYDHLDYNTVMLIGNNASWIVPLGLRSWFKEQGIHTVNEYDWWDEDLVEGISITCLPSQHWSKRTLFKEFDTLWSSWSIEYEGFKFWFAGDTGYNLHQFKEIGNRVGPFDFAAIPIGGYEPRWFMKNFHIDPFEALKIHSDVKSKKSIGIHWGTFILTTEPVDDPPQKLRWHMEKQGLDSMKFITPSHGEIITFE